MILVKNDNGADVTSTRCGNVTKIALKETNEVVAWNIFQASEMLGEISGVGQVVLSDEQIALLNEELAKEGFREVITQEKNSKFVIGFVKELTPHPDSDHLNIAQVEVDNGEMLQIVAGAPNIEQGQLVVVAKVGAMMPNGLVIWDGELRGVKSSGMMCSPRELQLENAPDVRGILVLEEGSATIGEAFSPEKHWHG